MSQRNDSWGYLPKDRSQKQACFECGNETTGRHHVVPVSMGGTKVIPLCSTCHNKAHACNTIQPHLIKEALNRRKEAGHTLGAPVKLDQATREQIEQAFQKGATIRAIADRFNISVGYAHTIKRSLKSQ